MDRLLSDLLFLYSHAFRLANNGFYIYSSALCAIRSSTKELRILFDVPSAITDQYHQAMTSKNLRPCSIRYDPSSAMDSNKLGYFVASFVVL